MKSLVEIQNLTFAYEGHSPAIKDLNLLIHEGEYIALLGPNGCGKTTLIRHLNGLLIPSFGSVLVGNLSTHISKNLSEIRRQIGMVFQNPDNQIVGMSVEEDVAFGPGNLNLPPVEVRLRVDRALGTVGLSDFKTRSPHSLSGGQKQLLALAGLLAMEPKLIILDEPTSSLDPAGKQHVLAILRKLNNTGIGIIHVTHSMTEAALSERLLVMDQGNLVADGKPCDILTRVDWLKSLGLAPPKITELMWRLQQAGENIESSIFSIEDAVQAITVLLNQLRSDSSQEDNSNV